MGTATRSAPLETPAGDVAAPTGSAATPGEVDPFAAAAAAVRTARRPSRRRRPAASPVTAPAAVAAVTAHPHRVDPPEPVEPAARLAAAVAAVIAPFGVPDAERRNDVITAVEEFLRGRHIDAEVTSLRYGVLTLSTDPALVSFVRCDANEIAEVCTAAGLELRDVRVRTRR